MRPTVHEILIFSKFSYFWLKMADLGVDKVFLEKLIKIFADVQCCDVAVQWNGRTSPFIQTLWKLRITHVTSTYPFYFLNDDEQKLETLTSDQKYTTYFTHKAFEIKFFLTNKYKNNQIAEDPVETYGCAIFDIMFISVYC